MYPYPDDLITLLELEGISQEQALEYVGNVTQVELIVEVDCSFTEIADDEHVQLEGGLDDGWALLLNGGLESLQVATQEGVVDEEEGLIIWNGD
jgi:hypothetical protein